jgi:Cys-tRNA(Pro) deacylase
MPRSKPIVTPATRLLSAAGVDYRLHVYDFVPGPVAATASGLMDLPLHSIVKTLVWETNQGSPFLLLMHGDLQVRARSLAEKMKVRKVRPCAMARAEQLTGYQVGGISPFGVRVPLPVYAEASITELELVILSAGRRGAMLELASSDLVTLLRPSLVSAGGRAHESGRLAVS